MMVMTMMTDAHDDDDAADNDNRELDEKNL